MYAQEGAFPTIPLFAKSKQFVTSKNGTSNANVKKKNANATGFLFINEQQPKSVPILVIRSPEPPIILKMSHCIEQRKVIQFLFSKCLQHNAPPFPSSQLNGLALIVYFHFEQIGGESSKSFTADKWFSLADWISLEEWLATHISIYKKSSTSTASATTTSNGSQIHLLQSGAIQCTLNWLKVATSFGRRIKDVLNLSSRYTCIDYVSICVKPSPHSSLGQQIEQLQHENATLKCQLNALTESTPKIKNVAAPPPARAWVASPDMFVETPTSEFAADEIVIIKSELNVDEIIKTDDSYEQMICNEIKMTKENSDVKSQNIDEYVPKDLNAAEYQPGNSEQNHFQEEYLPVTTPPTDQHRPQFYNPNSSGGGAAEHDQYIPPGNIMDSAAPAYTPSRKKKRQYARLSSDGGAGDDDDDVGDYNDKYDPTTVTNDKNSKKTRLEKKPPVADKAKHPKGLFGDSDDDAQQQPIVVAGSSSSSNGSCSSRVLLDRKAKKTNEPPAQETPNSSNKLQSKIDGWLCKPSLDREKIKRQKEKKNQTKQKTTTNNNPLPPQQSLKKDDASKKRDREIAILQKITKELQPEKLPKNVKMLDLKHFSNQELEASFNDHKDLLTDLFTEFRKVLTIFLISFFVCFENIFYLIADW